MGFLKEMGRLQETCHHTTSTQTEEKKDCKYFVICESCFWCASCFEQSSIEVCASCEEGKIESIPLSIK